MENIYFMLSENIDNWILKARNEGLNKGQNRGLEIIGEYRNSREGIISFEPIIECLDKVEQCKTFSEAVVIVKELTVFFDSQDLPKLSQAIATFLAKMEHLGRECVFELFSPNMFEDNFDIEEHFARCLQSHEYTGLVPGFILGLREGAKALLKIQEDAQSHRNSEQGR